MQNQPNAPIHETFGRDSADMSVIVADGYGLTINVHHGHLVVEDGVGTHRRKRRYSRAERKIRRVVILGHTGMITLDAIRWCADVGIAIHHLDTAGRVLASSAPKRHDDARLRRAQALAANSGAGVEIARYLLAVKLDGQADIAGGLLDRNDVAETIRADITTLHTADLHRCRDIESQAANLYFSAWYPSATATFARRDQRRVPDHWRGFIARNSPLLSGRTSRNAADPINALLNYGYALLEVEAVVACEALGLDPGMGFVHTDKPERASLALDLMEAGRPVVDRYVLTLLQEQVFRGADFHETRDGRCRLLAPLTHHLASNAPAWHSVLAPHAEQVAHLVAESSGAPIRRRTPLTKTTARAAQRRGANPRLQSPPTEVKPTVRCVECGAALTNRRQKRCGSCEPLDLVRRGHQQIGRANVRLAQLRARGEDPCVAPEVVDRKRAQLRRNRSALLEWQRANPDVVPDPQIFIEQIQPNLASRTIAELQRATGLSASACSRIRGGKLVPHVRHWRALRMLADSTE